MRLDARVRPRLDPRLLGLPSSTVASAAALTLYGVSLRKFRLALRPAGIAAAGPLDGDAVTSWACATGANAPAIATSCALDTATIPGKVGVRLDGAASRLDGAASWSDDGCTVFAVKRMLTPPSGGRGALLEASDTGATGRSLRILSAFGSMQVDRTQGAGSTASYIDDDLALHVHRFRVSGESAEVWRDGVFAGSSCVDGGPARPVAAYRVGCLFGEQWFWQGALYELFVAVGLTRAEELRVERGLMADYGVASPALEWPLAAASDQSGDPRLLLPPSLRAVVGLPVTLFRDGVHLADGLRPQALSASGAVSVDRSLPDRWVLTPTAEGTSQVTLTEGSYTATVSLVARPPISALASPRRIMWTGDSNAARATADGAVRVLRRRLGSRAVFVGPYGTAPTQGCGIDSTTWAYWASVSTPGFVDNPWACGGMAVDVPQFVDTALGGVPPDALVISIQNDATNATPGGVDAVFAAREADMQQVFDWWRAVNPSVVFLLLTIYPGATDPAAGWGTWASRMIFREKWHRWAELLQARFGAEDEGVYLSHTFSAVDGFGYPTIGTNADAHHPGRSPDHVLIADRVEADLAHLIY